MQPAPALPRRTWPLLRGAAALLASVVVVLPGRTRAADPVRYDVQLAATRTGPLDAAARDALTLLTLRDKAPVGGFALLGRARADQGRLVAVLQSFGFYDGQADVTVAGRALDDAALPALLDALPQDSVVPVRLALVPGPQYRLRHVGLSGDAPAGLAEKLGLAPGAPAAAADVLAARARLEAALLDGGHALAKVGAPVATLVPAEKALDVTYPVAAGPAVNLGPIEVAGLRSVDESYVRRRLLLHPGDPYRPAAIEAARQDLATRDVFASVRITWPDHLDPQGTLPVQVAVTERKLRAVSLGAAYSTDLGASATASWTHRNLFGGAERLVLQAGVTQIGGSAARQPGYSASATLTFPDLLRRNQDLTLNLGAVKEYLQAYDRTAAFGGAVASRRLSPDWTASVGLQAEQARFVQEKVGRDYTLLQVPLTLGYDTAHELFEPTHGIRAAASVTPSESLGRRSATFVIAQASAATYVDLAGQGRTVLALRGLVGGVEGASVFDIPPDQRFFGGGTATIRGFRYQSVGPLFPDGRPVGGTSVDAATVELRQRIGASFGAAAFVDAGQVGTSGTPFTGRDAVGAGVGARYYTSIGPIRVDLAVPLTRVRKNDVLEAYIGLGEAF